MLEYQKLTPIEKEMVNKEIRSNFNTSSKSDKEYKRILHNVHDGTYCCNCFRSKARCCCEKLEDCYDDIEFEES